MLEYLNLHTKVRRLGYLKLLVQQYFDKDFLPVTSFDQYFEKVSGTIAIQKQLDDYAFYYRKDNKGIIDNIGTGASAEPYTKLAEDLSIIAKNNYSYILTKHGKIYKVILERYQKEGPKFKFIEEQKLLQPIALFDLDTGGGNIFILNALDKFFFLKQFFEKDYIYIKSILNIIEFAPKEINLNVKYSSVKNQLIQEIIKQLNQYLSSSYINSDVRTKIIDFEKKLSEKKLKIRSYESIVEPRINWLLDLDLIDGVKHRQGILKLTTAGKGLVDITKNVFDVTSFLESKYVKTFCFIYGLTPKFEKYPEKRIEKYLNYAFINFKTLAPNRINASQAINYIVLMCLLRDGINLEYSEVKKYLFSIDGKGYTIDWFPSENDGSIKKQKND